MRVALFPAPKTVEIVERPLPEAPPGWVLVKNACSAICGSDKGLWFNGGGEALHGHEMCGTVEALGEGVNTWKVGDRVTALVVTGCGECLRCKRGEWAYCETKKGLSGGFAEYFVAPATNLYALPDWLTDVQGCLVTDNLGTPARAVRLSGIKADEAAVVFGAGPIGLNCVQTLVATGVTVTSVDTVDFRLAKAAELGAAYLVNGTGEEAVGKLKSLFGGIGPEWVFECCGKANREALNAVCSGGQVVFVGENFTKEIHTSDDLIRKCLRVMGTWYLARSDVELNLQLIKTSACDPARLVTHKLPFEEIAQGFELFCEHPDECLKVVLLF